jgi:hypothetical protein
MTWTKNVAIGAVLIAAAGFGAARFGWSKAVTAQDKSAVMAPQFEVNPFWPKPLPNHWVLGQTIGVSVDSQDHVFIVHRGAELEEYETYAAATPKISECCAPAPPVLEFDPAGNLVRAWGGPGPGYQWPEKEHGITVDSTGNVWIGGNGASDGHVVRFTREGKFVKQYGFRFANASSNDDFAFFRAAKVFLDEPKKEAYISDGYGNHRVAVVDMESGKMKRYWGAYGNKPDDTDLGPYNPKAPPAKQFRNPVHCAEIAVDNNVYVCDRKNDRVQVFTKEGRFVKEAVLLKETLGNGSVWDLAFSKDPQQKYMYIADGSNDRIHIFDRASLTELTSFGDGGRQPGQFYAVHSIATDSKGNIYTTETFRGQRVQQFMYKGLAPVTKSYQGTVWPANKSSN